jgi:hypothetical protein
MFNKLKTLHSLDGYQNDELLLLRDRINEKLEDLSNINLEQELVGQFMSVKGLLSDAYSNNDETSSQKASLINACSAILRDLAKTQTMIYNAERVKLLEQILIETLKEVGPEIATRFLELYEKNLEEKLT